MIQKRYSAQIYSILKKQIQPTPKVFIFGSALVTGSFADVDVGLLGSPVSEHALYRAKEELEESTLPYKIDLIDFSVVEPSFKKEVLSGKIQWLT